MRRVVITGLGAITPCGLSCEQTWDNIVKGRSGIGPVTRFDASEYRSRIAGEVRGFDPGQWIDKRRQRQAGRFVHYAIAASDEAVVQSRIQETIPKERIGTIIGVGLGGLGMVEDNVHILKERGPRRVSPYFIPAVIPNLAAAQVSIRFGFEGNSFAPVSACASGAHAIGVAYRAIQCGELDACVAGGSESTITGLAFAGFSQMRALSTRNDKPDLASRPFDRSRDGFVMAEGAASLILESRDVAISRNAPILAELVGYGASSDAHHITTPRADGAGPRRAILAALEDARINPEKIGYINAHATSTGLGDLAELAAIRSVFGRPRDPHSLPISSTKSLTGHLLGAAGALEAMISVLALRDGRLPATANLIEPVPEAEGFDLVPGRSREQPFDYALTNSFGFGGANVCLIFRAPR